MMAIVKKNGEIRKGKSNFFIRLTDKSSHEIEVTKKEITNIMD